MRFWHGLQTYDQGLSTQEMARERVEDSGQTEVHGFEFHSVITLGKRAQKESDLLTSEIQIKEKGFSVRHVDRGGEATLHNPGQIVIYPIVNLRTLGMGVRDYIEGLQITTVRLLNAYGIECVVKSDCPGVYTSRGKIGFIGVRIRHGVSTHGLSINVRNDLRDFQNIRSCGEQSPSLDRMVDWRADASNNILFQQWSELFLNGLLLDRKRAPRLTHEPFQTLRS